MAEDVVAGHPLLMKTAVLSGECVDKLEIFWKHLYTNQKKVFYYSNPSSSGTPNLVLTLLRLFALAIAHIWFLK
jgi:hypothetical protein